MEVCKKNSVQLFHITERRNLETIAKEGLKINRVNLERIVNLRYDFISGEDPDYTMEQAREDVEPMIFATTEEGVKNLTLIEDAQDPVIIGIRKTKRGECAALFWKGEVNSFYDWTAVEDITPECLCLITNWS